MKAGANGLAQRHLTDAVKLFSELDEIGHEENFITVLLQLGQNYVQQQQLDTGKGCYEWALLLSISAGLLECTCPHSQLGRSGAAQRTKLFFAVVFQVS